MFKSNALSNIDIINILKSQKIKINGVFMKDELPSKLKRGYYVINLQSSNVGNGSHWTALYYSPENSFYFDAFGFISPQDVEKRIIPYVYSTTQIQDLNSTACGYYCIAFIIFMDKQKNKMDGFKNFVTHFSEDTEENDKKLYNFLYG